MPIEYAAAQSSRTTERYALGMAVPELMRILLDSAKLGWNQAFDLTKRTLGVFTTVRRRYRFAKLRMRHPSQFQFVRHRSGSL
jgi:hypothetical protein